MYGAITHKIRTNKDGMSVADFTADVYKSLVGPIYIEGHISTLTEAGEYEILLKSEIVNFCEVDDAVNKYPQIEEAIAELKKRGNITIGCPLNKSFYYLNEFYIPDSAIPSFAPPGKYRTDIFVTVDDGPMKENSMFNTSWYSTVV